jgi:hypothetical protein
MTVTVSPFARVSERDAVLRSCTNVTMFSTMTILLI